MMNCRISAFARMPEKGHTIKRVSSPKQGLSGYTRGRMNSSDGGRLTVFEWVFRVRLATNYEEGHHCKGRLLLDG